MPDVRQAYAPALVARVAHGPHHLFYQPSAPREHDRCSSASVPSFDRSREASSPCTPPTRASEAHRVSGLTATACLSAASRVLGSLAVHPASFLRTGVVHLTPADHRGSATPGFRPLAPSQPSLARRAPANHPRARAIGSFSLRALPLPNPASQAACLTPACSGLAALAADARR